MRIENITKDNIKELLPIELRNIKIRFMQIYDNHFSDPLVKTAVNLDRYMFYKQYMILRNEMHRRDIEYLEDSALDKVKEVNIKTFLKSIYGIDVPALPEMAIVKSYVAVSGTFMAMPKEAKYVEVVVRNVEENKDESLEKKIAMIVKAHTGKEPKFTYRPTGPNSTYMPLFDLVLRARDEIKVVKVEKPTKQLKKKIVDVKKPEETENMISIPVGPDCEVTATITIDKVQGITALYCGKIKEVRTFKFDKRVKAWTMASARAWIKEHKEKVAKQIAEKINKQMEENLENFEYLIHHVEVDGDKEIVHHCYLYDHIGNLFEQTHLWIDKGKIYLDGKEIKEGHYHVIKGLEPKQEFAWSEEEAIEAKIKPKQMTAGMTLKEKAKVW